MSTVRCKLVKRFSVRRADVPAFVADRQLYLAFRAGDSVDLSEETFNQLRVFVEEIKPKVPVEVAKKRVSKLKRLKQSAPVEDTADATEPSSDTDDGEEAN